MRWRWMAVTAVSLGLGGCAAGNGRNMTTSTSPAGIGISFEMDFDEDVTVTGGIVTTSGWAGPITFYRGDGDLVGEALPVERGMIVQPGFNMRPPCDGPATAPEVVIESTRADGTSRADPIELDDDRFADAFDEWCDGGIRTDSGTGTIWPDGRREVDLQIGNPGPDAAAVSVADDDIWGPAATEVAGGDTTRLKVPGTAQAAANDGTPLVIPLLVTVAGVTTRIEVPVGRVDS